MLYGKTNTARTREQLIQDCSTSALSKTTTCLVNLNVALQAMFWTCNWGINYKKLTIQPYYFEWLQSERENWHQKDMKRLWWIFCMNTESALCKMGATFLNNQPKPAMCQMFRVQYDNISA